MMLEWVYNKGAKEWQLLIDNKRVHRAEEFAQWLIEEAKRKNLISRSRGM